MIDIHTHLLPGVDDGSRTIEQSVGVLRAFVAAGVHTVVCTPHLDASRARSAPHDEHAALLAELRAACPDHVNLQRGWEIMLDEPRADLSDPRLRLAGSTAVLVELPRPSIPPNAAEELFRLRMAGLVPVLAHPERYRGVTPAIVTEWRRVGAVIQTDVAALSPANRYADTARALLREGLIDLLSSDTHGDSRSLGTAAEWLHEIGAERHAELLLKENAARVLSDRPVLPVPPLDATRGMLVRLRDLLRGRREGPSPQGT